jgi:colicin import membrane protein
MAEEIKTTTADEIEIINKMITGEIIGPVITATHFLMNIRITGTGETIREYDGRQYVFNRPAGVFLSDKFLQMCNGLPVAWLHPSDRGEVRYSNFKEYIIGTIVKPYVKGIEVWGIAKIFDLTKLDEIYNGVESTSPYVTSKNVGLPDGRVEEELQSINHVAIVPSGHWDQVATEEAIKKGEIIFKKTDALEKETPEEKTDYDWSQNDVNMLAKKSLSELRKRQEIIFAQQKEAYRQGNEKAAVELRKHEEAVRQAVSLREFGDAKKDEISRIVDNSDAKELQLTNKPDKTFTGGNNMAEEKKVDANLTQIDPNKKPDVAPVLPPEKKDDKKPDDCSDAAKKKADEDAAAKKKADEDAEAQKKKDAEESGLEARLSKVEELLKKIVTVEKKEAEVGKEHETLTADDDEKEQIINAVSELADQAHSTIVIKRPAPKKFESKFDYISRTLNLNKEFVQPKYHDLLSKLDAGSFALAKDAFAAMKEDVLTKTRELNKAAKGAVVKIQTPDGATTDVNYLRN